MNNDSTQAKRAKVNNRGRIRVGVLAAVFAILAVLLWNDAQRTSEAQTPIGSDCPEGFACLKFNGNKAGCDTRQCCGANQVICQGLQQIQAGMIPSYVAVITGTGACMKRKSDEPTLDACYEWTCSPSGESCSLGNCAPINQTLVEAYEYEGTIPCPAEAK